MKLSSLSYSQSYQTDKLLQSRMANSFLLLANLKTDCCSTKTEVRFLIDVLGRQKSQKHGAEHDTEELESLNHRVSVLSEGEMLLPLLH